jgi:hypothetical protein
VTHSKNTGPFGNKRSSKEIKTGKEYNEWQNTTTTKTGIRTRPEVRLSMKAMKCTRAIMEEGIKATNQPRIMEVTMAMEAGIIMPTW